MLGTHHQDATIGVVAPVSAVLRRANDAHIYHTYDSGLQLVHPYHYHSIYPFFLLNIYQGCGNNYGCFEFGLKKGKKRCVRESEYVHFRHDTYQSKC